MEETADQQIKKSRIALRQAARVIHEKAELTGPDREHVMSGLTYTSQCITYLSERLVTDVPEKE